MRYDICFKCDNANVVSRLIPIGLTATDESGTVSLAASGPHHDLIYAKRIEVTPAIIGAEGDQSTPATYLDGEYLVLRAEPALLDALLAALPDGLEEVDLPPGCPTFGDWRPRPTPVDQVAALEAAREVACKTIDNHAETLRLSVITPGAGQMAAYLRKEQQARAFQIATIPTDPEELEAFRKTYSAIYGEVGITADTPEEVADIVVANADAWYAFGDAVEPVRLAGKQAVEAAGSKAAIDAAVAAIDWPTP